MSSYECNKSYYHSLNVQTLPGSLPLFEKIISTNLKTTIWIGGYFCFINEKAKAQRSCRTGPRSQVSWEPGLESTFGSLTMVLSFLPWQRWQGPRLSGDGVLSSQLPLMWQHDSWKGRRLWNQPAQVPSPAVPLTPAVKVGKSNLSTTVMSSLSRGTPVWLAAYCCLD